MSQDHGTNLSHKKKNNNMALTGFVLSIFSAFLYQLIVLPILAVVFSAIGLSSFNPEIHHRKWMAIVGLVIGILYTLMAGLSFLQAVYNIG